MLRLLGFDLFLEDTMSASPLGVSKLSVLDGCKGGMMHIPTLGSVSNLSVLIVGAYCGEVAGEKAWSQCCICAIPCQTMAAAVAPSRMMFKNAGGVGQRQPAH